MPQRGRYDREAVRAILDEGLVCHVGFASGGRPFVIPTAYGRIDDRLYLHGAAANHMLRSLEEGAEACVTVTLLDGLVLARSAFHTSMNYRAVVLFGTARPVDDPGEKRAALRAIVEQVVPGRWDEVRGPSDQELAATRVIWLPIEEASAKIRSGGPADDEEDYALPVWAGVLPLPLTAAAPTPDPRLAPDVATPSYLTRYQRPAADL
jgi:nitroimidazol reductase NimA-like FMN-containing flavoprotein (pyridoxamine 5'-phosphate oxidase superfamily)